MARIRRSGKFAFVFAFLIFTRGFAEKTADCALGLAKQNTEIRKFAEALIPKTAKFQFISAEKIRKKETPTSESSEEDSNEYVSDSRYLRDLDVVKNLVRKNFAEHADIPVALYVASGSDGAIAHRILSPILSVGVDVHPVLKGNVVERSRLDVYPNTGTRFRHTVDIDRMDDELAPRLIGAFYRQVRGFRLRGFFVFNTMEVLNRHDRRFHDHKPGAYHRRRASHGLLVFDTGPGTPLRAHLQIQQDLTPEIDVRETWWFKKFTQNYGPRFALIEKASHGAYDAGDGDVEKMWALRNSLRNAITESKGLWIEGAHTINDHSYWEFSPEDSIKYARTRVQNLRSWGYDQGLRIVAH
jgi:hypothetical protein